MGELKNEEEQLGAYHPLPPKRKPDNDQVEKDNDDVLLHSQSKKPKPEALLETKLIEPNHQDQDTEEEDEYDEEDDEEEDEHSNGEADFDVKGKGIMKDDKGKGKLIEESEEEDDDDDSSGDDDDAINVSDDDSDSDLSDDPLAEVDLDNILPSRTRSRRGASRGLFIANNDHNDNGDDDK